MLDYAAIKREDLPVKRSFDEYIVNYRKLDFETTQERFRLQRLLEVIDKLQSIQNFQNILEIGPGGNSVYKKFLEFDSYTILEPIKYFLETLKIENLNVDIRNETVEEFIESKPKNKFDLIILSSVIHEIENPKLFLISLSDLIEVKTKILVVVPNNQSIHRIIGELEGFEKAGAVLTQTERRMQQGMSFSVESFVDFATLTGYKVTEIFTSFIKPLPHFKMHDLQQSGALSESDLNSLYSLSNFLQPYGSEIFAILEKAND